MNNPDDLQRSQIEQLSGRIAALNGEHDQALTAYNAARVALATATSERERVAGDLQLAFASLNIPVVAAEEPELASPAVHASSLLSGMGMPALAMSGGSDDEGIEAPGLSATNAAFAKYRSIKDPKARAQYYAEHKAEMFPPKKAATK